MTKEPLSLQGFRPISQLVVPETRVERPRFSVIDAHIHLQPPFGGDWTERPVDELLDVMDEAGVRALVDLDGGWGEAILDAHLAHFKEHAPDRFAHFGGVDWSQWSHQGDGFGTWAAARFRQQVTRGAEGLKVWKPFGLEVRDHRGERVAVDDERLDPLWAAAAELRVPVLIHVADPVAFFEPLDQTNERWEELHAHPDWHFPHPTFPRFDTLMAELASLIRRHRDTTFIGAHVGCYAENLAWVASLLDECPNFHVDISARLGELGRQPYSARRFMLDYADRILFGTDADASPDSYRLYYRFLESADEYFSYNLSDPPRQGRWYAYGLYLPDEVLEKLYHRNAERVIFGGSI